MGYDAKASEEKMAESSLHTWKLAVGTHQLIWMDC